MVILSPTSKQKEMDTLFEKTIPNIGTISLRNMNVAQDSSIIHQWVKQDYAAFWDMQKHTLTQVTEAYNDIANNEYHQAYIGLLNEKPIFLMENYQPEKDIIGSYYHVIEGDLGMHILVGPPTKRIPGFTWAIFSFIMEYMFEKTPAKRIVVEPDVRNDKIHILNKKAGFTYHKTIALPNKTGYLATCTKADFYRALSLLET